MLNFIRGLFRRSSASGTIAIGPNAKKGSYLESLHFSTVCYKCGSRGEANFKVTPAMRASPPGSTFSFHCLDCGTKQYLPVDKLLAAAEHQT